MRAIAVLVVMKSAIYDTKAAEQLGVLLSEIQRRNLLREGDLFPYRQPSCAPPNRPAC
jgi:xanthine dehydrogenase large subunit